MRENRKQREHDAQTLRVRRTKSQIKTKGDSLITLRNRMVRLERELDKARKEFCAATTRIHEGC